MESSICLCVFVDADDARRFDVSALHDFFRSAIHSKIIRDEDWAIDPRGRLPSACGASRKKERYSDDGGNLNSFFHAAFAFIMDGLEEQFYVDFACDDCLAWIFGRV